MAYTYKYLVGNKGSIKTVQKAINNIAYELENETSDLYKDIEIVLEPGVYSAFKIPRGSFLPLLGTDYKVIIKPAGNYFPIIDGKITPLGQNVGIDIDSANPNVHIKSLRIQNFTLGLRASNGSHKPFIEKNIFSGNKNAAALVQGCSDAVFSQNMVTNGDYGFIARLCKDIGFFHNSIFIDGSIGKGVAGIWAQLANDYGGGLSDTGKIHMLGNIIWNMVGPNVILFEEDLDLGAVVSNYNNFVKSSSYLIGLEKKAYVPTETRTRRKIENLIDWKRLNIRSNPDSSVLDSKSISKDPKFVQTVKSNKNNGLYIDLEVLPLSPVLGLVPSYYIDLQSASTWLPDYFDSSYLSTDILNKQRIESGTAAGANDRKSNSGFFGQDVFITPRDLLLTKNCDINPISDIINQKLDLWFPKLKTGYFYSHERKYYLYAKKACRKIGECAVTYFNTPHPILSTYPIKVYIAGKEINTGDYLDIAGNTIILYHKDLNIVYGDEEFEIECWIRKWNNSTSGFSYHPTKFNFKIHSGKTKYYLPSDYVNMGPVVVTDDVSCPSDDDKLSNREFKLKFNEGEQKSEIVFSNSTNFLDNAQFDIYLSEAPLKWSSSGAKVVDFSGQSYPSGSTVMGDYACRVASSGYIKQLVPLVSGENYSLSWHSRQAGLTNEDVTGNNYTGEYKLYFYDHMYNSLGYTMSGEYPVSENWQREYLTFGDYDPLADKVHEFRYPVSAISLSGTIPNEASYAEIELKNKSDGDIWIDAVQFENTIRPTPYHRKFYYNELTVEYETSDRGYYIDTRNAIAPARNLFSQGFMYIPELPASIYGGPANQIITTLYEYRWADGRTNILPWSRISGKDKLRNKPIFNIRPDKKYDTIQPSHATHIPTEISVYPDSIVSRQGDKVGSGLQLYVSNKDGNPYFRGAYSLYLEEPKAKYPGVLVKRFYGAKEQMGDTLAGLLDSAGSAQGLWIPPDRSDIVYSDYVPRRPKTNGDAITSVNLNYRINVENFGNATITNDFGTPIETSAKETSTNYYFGSYSSSGTIFKLKYPITAGSVKVTVDGESLTETHIGSPNSDQFYVNYNEGAVLLKGKVSKKIKIEYLPKYIFTNSSKPYKLFFYHDKVFGDYSGPITIDYDALINLRVKIFYPSRYWFIEKEYGLVAQNPSIGSEKNINKYAVEY